MAKKKTFPEFELPKIITDSIADYLGTRKINKLTQSQRQEIHDVAQAAACRVARLLDKKEQDESAHS